MNVQTPSYSGKAVSSRVRPGCVRYAMIFKLPFKRMHLYNKSLLATSVKEAGTLRSTTR